MGTQEHWTAAQYQEYLRQRAKGNNKYHAVKVEVDGTVYASQSESRRAKELHLLERHGLVRNLREQVPYELIPAGVGKYRKERSVVYKADFVYEVCQPDGEQMLSNGSCGYILYGHPEYTPETLRMVADLAEDDSVIMTRMQKADLPLADQCPNEEYAEPLDTCIVAAGAVWQPLVVGASMAFINRRALQPIEKEEEGYDLYRRGDLVVVKSGLIVQGVIRTMDLSKAEAVCRDLINLGTVAGMAIEERNNEE